MVKKRKQNLSDILIPLAIVFYGIVWIIIVIFKLFYYIIYGIILIISFIISFFKNKNSSNKTLNTKSLILQTKYDSNFREIIRKRGIEYYKENKVLTYNNFHKKITGIVKGTNEYNVSFTIKDNELIEYSCTCPYFSKDNEPCKHIYALLIKYINTNSKVNNSIKTKLKIDSKSFIDTIKEYNNEKNKLEENKKSQEHNRVKELYDLTEEQMKEVEDGNYDPWNFEEENLEEDDYYYDDPK